MHINRNMQCITVQHGWLPEWLPLALRADRKERPAGYGWRGFSLRLLQPYATLPRIRRPAVT